jgi:hypothetical protein
VAFKGSDTEEPYQFEEIDKKLIENFNSRFIRYFLAH